MKELNLETKSCTNCFSLIFKFERLLVCCRQVILYSIVYGYVFICFIVAYKLRKIKSFSYAFFHLKNPYYSTIKEMNSEKKNAKKARRKPSG